MGPQVRESGAKGLGVTDLAVAAENVRNTRALLAAHHQFRREVGALMLRLLEERDPAGQVLLELIRDLDARTAELYVNDDERTAS